MCAHADGSLPPQALIEAYLSLVPLPDVLAVDVARTGTRMTCMLTAVLCSICMAPYIILMLCLRTNMHRAVDYGCLAARWVACMALACVRFHKTIQHSNKPPLLSYTEFAPINNVACG